jgi:hypothetical protein
VGCRRPGYQRQHPLSVQYAVKFASQHRKYPSTQGEHCQVYCDKHKNKSFQKSKLHTYEGSPHVPDRPDRHWTYSLTVIGIFCAEIFCITILRLTRIPRQTGQWHILAANHCAPRQDMENLPWTYLIVFRHLPCSTLRHQTLLRATCFRG